MTDDKDIDGFFSTARVSGRTEALTLPADGYREYLFDLDDPKLAEVRGMTYEEFARDRYQAPFLRELLEFWDGLYREPFVGVTSDGVRREGLYALPTDAAAESAAAVAAQELLGTLTSGERDAICHDIDDPHWRAWSNPEFAVYRVGLRLEVLSEETYAAFDALLRASLSAQGYDRVTEAMALNGFLGEVTGLPTIMNARSYHFAIYGTPDPVEPWGWQIFGHHVVVNVVSVGGRQVIAPLFIGGEPALTEEHPPLFEARERLALELASSLDEGQRAKCVVYESVLDPAMPEGRLHPADERHVGGAFRDNRVVAYEGICASDLVEDQLGLLREIVADSLGLLTAPQLELALAEYDNHLEETWFAWYGPTDGSGPCYYRVHSPVILAELDHHAGVWLSNRLPARFHVHTTLRHPNGNDYGKALIDQWRARPS